MKTTSTWPKGAWTPKRRGNIYCSLACGGNCTHRAFLKANNDAQKLAAKMGGGWKPRVWENLGWHHEVISPCRRLRIHGRGASFTAFLCDKGEQGGRYVETAQTAKSAMEKVVATAKADLAKIGAIIKGL